MKGIVIEELTVTPRQLNLGEVKAGGHKVGELKLLNTSKRSIKITSLKASMQQITVTTKKRVLKPGESTSIQVSVVPTGDNRFLGGYITISTDSRGKSEKTVQVYAVVRK